MRMVRLLCAIVERNEGPAGPDMTELVMRTGTSASTMMGCFAALLLTGAVTATAQEAAPAAAPAAPPAIIEGTWQTQSKSEITITRCDQSFCGAITKIVVPPEMIAKYGNDLAAIGTNYTDQNNKDPALRSRPIQDLQILVMQPRDNPLAFKGQLYNPQDGNIYDGNVEVLGPDRIKLNGCVLFNLLCMGEEWARVIPEPEEAVAASPVQAPIPAHAPVRAQQ